MTKHFAGLVKRFEKGEGRTLTEEEKKIMKEALRDPTGFRFAIPKERTLMVFGAFKRTSPDLPRHELVCHSCSGTASSLPVTTRWCDGSIRQRGIRSVAITVFRTKRQR